MTTPLMRELFDSAGQPIFFNRDGSHLSYRYGYPSKEDRTLCGSIQAPGYRRFRQLFVSSKLSDSERDSICPEIMSQAASSMQNFVRNNSMTLLGFQHPDTLDAAYQKERPERTKTILCFDRVNTNNFSLRKDPFFNTFPYSHDKPKATDRYCGYTLFTRNGSTVERGAKDVYAEDSKLCPEVMEFVDALESMDNIRARQRCSNSPPHRFTDNQYFAQTTTYKQGIKKFPATKTDTGRGL